MGMTTVDVDAVVEGYKSYLLVVRGADQEKAYCDRLRSDQDAAELEAVMFAALRDLGLGPQLNESLSTGGADFVCQQGPDSEEFVVEVTHLDRGSLATRSNVPDGPHSGSYHVRSIASKLLGVARGKENQCEQSGLPAVLAIGTSHSSFRLLASHLQASDLLLGDSKIGPTGPVTELRESVFCRPAPDGAGIEVAREAISGLLLIWYGQDCYYMTGLLHPVPKRPWDYRCMEHVPFIRFAKWPPENGTLETEWVIGQPTRFRSAFSQITLTNSELGKDTP